MQTRDITQKVVLAYRTSLPSDQVINETGLQK